MRQDKGKQQADGFDDYLQRLFTKRQHPMYWLISARDLRDAAETIIKDQEPVETKLWEALTEQAKRPKPRGVYWTNAEHPNYTPAHMLYAFATENLIKGLIMAEQPERIGKDELDSTIANHNLLKLVGLISLKFDDDEQKLLERLTHTILWAGRYPVSKVPTGMMPKGRDGSRLMPKFIHWSEEHGAMRRLYQRLDGDLEAYLEDHDPSVAAWYAVGDAQSLLDKAKQDFRNIHGKARHVETQVNYAVDCAISLWVMVDWLWVERREQLSERLGIKTEADYWSWLQRQRDFESIRLCGEIASEDHPVKSDRYPPQILAAIASAASAMPNTGKVTMTAGEAENVSGNDAQPLLDGTMLKFVYVDHRREYAEPILRRAIEAWERILIDLGE